MPQGVKARVGALRSGVCAPQTQESKGNVKTPEEIQACPGGQGLFYLLCKLHLYPVLRPARKQPN